MVINSKFNAKHQTSFIFAVGRRKESVARVRLYEGRGENLVNTKLSTEYFSGEVARNLLTQPFKVAGVEGKYFVTAKVEGGGKTGQMEAVILGIARALALADKEKLRPLLKKQHFLTRDARIRERRKVGTGGKARRKKQSPKR